MNIKRPFSTIVASLLGAAFLPHARECGAVMNPLIFFDAPKEGGGGDPPKSKGTLEEQLTQARADLTAAQSSVGTLTKERDQARSDLGAVTTERDNLKSQFDSLTTSASKLRTDLESAQSQVNILTGERDTANRQLGTATENVSRLESLCKVKGVNPQASVPVVTEPGNEKTEEEWVASYSAAKTPSEKAAVLSEMEKAAAARQAAKSAV